MSRAAEPVLIGFDLNATRVRAVTGPAGAPQVLPLDGRHADLPTAVSLEGRLPDVGRAGTRICRRLPHLACINFLAHLGGKRLWGTGRKLLSADAALAVLLERLRAVAGRAEAATLALPAYLSPDQLTLGTALAGQARLPVVGMAATPFAAALAAHAEQPWSGIALVLDADDHALTWAAVAAKQGWAQLLETQALPQLGVQGWKGRLLDAVADRCVRQSRRDPRESAAAEQALYDRLDGVLEAAWQGRLAELIVETTHWYQNIFLRPDEVAGDCAQLLRQALSLTVAFHRAARAHGEVRAVVLTAAAARLPGLVGALEDRLDRLVVALTGDLADDAYCPPRVRILEAEAVAGAAHELAARVCAGDVPAGPVTIAPLPVPRPVDEGGARLRFRGRDYPLHGRAFVLGHHPTCDLVFDAEQYPAVAARHCEISCDRRGLVLHDRSQHGTTINDRPVIQQLPLHPGDWIRLGPRGPLLRFLGRTAAAAGSQRPAASG
jgi:hypothetical protein